MGYNCAVPETVRSVEPFPVAVSLRKTSTVRLVALTSLFCAAAIYEVVHLSVLLTPGVWVHLRTGVWILQNRSLPHSGLFSQYPNLRWNDFSWASDLLLGGMYRILGLRAIPILLMLLKVALAVVTFLLARAGRASFWGAVALSAIAQYLISDLQPLPYVFSILCFALELRLFIVSRQSGRARDLYWLPVLFLLWANLDIEFVLGLVLLGLFLLTVSTEQLLTSSGKSWVSEQIKPLDLRTAGVVALLSFAATFANPYTFHPLVDAWQTLYSHAGFEHFSEMSAMTFRRPQDFLLMLLVMAAFLAFGRRRSLDLFGLITLLAGTLVAFRIQRDGWLAVLPAVAWLAGGMSPSAEGDAADFAVSPERPWVAGLTAVAVLIAAVFVPTSNTLMNRVSQNMPVKACDYIRANRLAPPLYNAYIWGSFLTWYLREYPVAVDSRVELYGNDRLGKYFETAGGKVLLDSDPAVAEARTLLVEKESAMGKAFVKFPALRSRYRLVYSDDLASVFVPEPAAP